MRHLIHEGFVSGLPVEAFSWAIIDEAQGFV